MIEKLKQKARALKKEVFVLYLAYQNPQTPWYAKLFAMIVVAYAFSPIDLIPDFIPVLGYLDDLVLIPLGVSLALKMIPENVLHSARQEAEQRINQERQANWIAGGLIIVIWLIVIFVIARKLLS
jgi:uncharacterized membrane protein YkvA (DUF1232 family)